MRQQGAEIKGCGCMVRAFVEEIMGKKEILDASGLPKKLFTIIVLAGFCLVVPRFCALSIGRDLRSGLQIECPRRINWAEPASNIKK